MRVLGCGREARCLALALLCASLEPALPALEVPRAGAFAPEDLRGASLPEAGFPWAGTARGPVLERGAGLLAALGDAATRNTSREPVDSGLERPSPVLVVGEHVERRARGREQHRGAVASHLERLRD